MPTYGLTAEGFFPKTFDVIQAEIDADLRNALGLSVVTGVLAKLRDIFAERETKLWELAEAVYHAWDPSAATGDMLDALCELTRTLREEATRSLVELHLTGTPATVVTAGSRAATLSTAAQFETLADATIAAAVAWVTATVYAVGDIVYNDDRIYYCITAGTSDTGPFTEDEDITDGTAHWRFLGDGTGYVVVDSQAVETGPTEAISGDITTIVTPVGGWTDVINLLDADVGTDVETDGDLRIRRLDEVDAQGLGVPEAIRRVLLLVDDVTFVQVFYNDTDDDDTSLGVTLPPHSVMALVRGGANQDLWDALRTCVGAGIQTFGDTSGSSVDSEGVSHGFSFQRPDEVEIYIDLEVDYIAADVPSDYQTQMKSKIVTWGDARKTGYDVVASAVSAQVFKVDGIHKVRVCDIGTAANPSSAADISIGALQLAVFDTSRITIVDADAVTP
jgi:uncharacterized phage protein gp47/JayE